MPASKRQMTKEEKLIRRSRTEINKAKRREKHLAKHPNDKAATEREGV